LQIEASLMRLKHLSEKLLQLARAEAGLGAATDPNDLLPPLRVVIDDFSRTHPPGRLLFVVTDGTDLRAPMDVDAFGIAIRNLLENASRYGATDEPIVITTSTGVVEIANGGTTVPADKLAHLTDRFVRATDHAQGAGLGLSIVQSLLEQAGGVLELSSPVPGKASGFLARLVLPRP
jgi:two-component system OmpR family sensor kinase